MQEQSTSQSPASGNWQSIALGMFNNVWKSFSSLFRFTPDRDEPVKALLSPTEDSIVRQNLNLLLEQGKLALLTRDQVIYESSLKQANSWIKRYFALSGTAASGMVTELTQLQSEHIAPVQPDISHALVALKEYQTADVLPEAQQKAIPTESVQTHAPEQPSAAVEATKQPGVFVPEGDKQ